MLKLFIHAFMKRQVESYVTVVSTKTIMTLFKIVFAQTLLASMLVCVIVYQQKSTQFITQTAYNDISDIAKIKEANDRNQEIINKYADIQYRVAKVIRYNSNLRDPILIKEIADLEIASANVSKIPSAVGLALSVKESHFTPNAISYNGSSFGVKMINLKAHLELKPTLAKLLEPTYNIPVGYKILAEYSAASKSLFQGLKHYYGSTVDSQNFSYAQDIINKSKNIQRELKNG